MKRKFYIQEKHSIRIGEHYITRGQLTPGQAKKVLVAGGYSTLDQMIPYDLEDDYNRAIKELEKQGKKVL